MLKESNPKERSTLYFYHTTTRKENQKCEKYANILTILAKKWESAIKFVSVDCAKLRSLEDEKDSEFNSFCKTYHEDKLPIVVMDPIKIPDQGKASYYNDKEISTESLEKFIQECLPLPVKNVVTGNDLQKFLEDETMLSKALVFLHSIEAEKVGLEVNALSTEFYKK